jgi:hypothetical protein
VISRQQTNSDSRAAVAFVSKGRLFAAFTMFFVVLRIDVVKQWTSCLR